VRRRAVKNDSQAGYGLLFVAVMTVVGGGGWWLTRGGYPRSQPQPPAAPAAATVAPPNGPVDLAPEPAAAPTVPEPAEAPPTSVGDDGETSSDVAEESAGAKRPARRERTPIKAVGATRAGDPPVDAARADEAAADPDRPAVLTVKPRGEAANLPDTPNREAVIAALEPLRGAMAQCAGSKRGIAQLDITVSGAGLVTHAVVAGDFAGTPEGSCIARAARNAQFTAFQKPRFRVIYPFSF
jgi:hypothetical protein